MTNRERLVSIISSGIINGEDNYGMPTDKCLYEIADEILKEYTPKKKREYIRKSPCKCGASNRNAVLCEHQCLKLFLYSCAICDAETRWCSTKKQALVEWNKMNEVKG